MAQATLKAARGAVRPFDTRARKIFLDHLGMTANVTASAREAGVTSQTAYAYRRRYPRCTSPADHFGYLISPFGAWINCKLNWRNDNPK